MPRAVHLFSRGSADQVSGGYIYNARLMRGLEALGFEVTYHGNGGALGAIGEADAVVIDGLVLAELADRLEAHAGPLVALLHMRPDRLAADDPSTPAARILRRSAIVVTGDLVRDAVLAEPGLGATRVDCIAPGVDDDWRQKSHYAETAGRLLCLSNYVAGKGHLRMLDTLAELADIEWTLAMYGNSSFAPEIRAAVQERVVTLGLAGRVTVNDAVPHAAVNRLMIAGDLLLQFSADESYSMVTAEALACGLPVLSHPTGAVRAFSHHGTIAYVDTLDRAEVVRLLRGLLSDADSYARLRTDRPGPPRTWQQVAREFADVLLRCQ